MTVSDTISITISDSISTISEKALLSEYISNAQYKEAIALIDSLNLQEKEFQLQKAFCFQSLNNYRKAIEILSSLKEKYPDDIPIRMQLIECYESINEYKKSGEILEELITLQPENTYFQVRKGDRLYRDDNPKAAIAVYKGINEYDPVYLNKRIGICFEKTGQIDSAGIYYTQAWEADSLDVFSALSLVKIQLKEKLYDPALQNTERFLSYAPDNLQMKILNAYSYYNLDDYPEAVKRFEQCRELGDSSLITTRGLGISYYFLQNDSLAYPYLQEAYAMDTTNSVVLHALGQTALHIKAYPEAIEAFSTLLDRIKVESNTYYIYHKGLADAYKELGEYKNAVANYLICFQYTNNLETVMNLNYTVASLSENELNDLSTAIFYYRRYLNSLKSYSYSLEEKDKEKKEEEKISPEILEELNFKIEELTKHIELLQSKDPTIKWNN